MFRGTWNFSTPAMATPATTNPCDSRTPASRVCRSKRREQRATDGEKMTPAKAARADAILAASRCNQHELETPDVRVLYTPY